MDDSDDETDIEVEWRLFCQHLDQLHAQKVDTMDDLVAIIKAKKAKDEAQRIASEQSVANSIRKCLESGEVIYNKQYLTWYIARVAGQHLPLPTAASFNE